MNTIAAPVTAQPAAAMPMLRIERLSRTFARKEDLVGKALIRLGLAKAGGVVRAVDDVSLDIGRGQVMGLVGESGCGKSTLGRMVAGIIPPSAGEVYYEGEGIERRRGSSAAKSLKIQMIFQNPYGSLNPRARVAEIIGEAPRVHGLAKGSLADYVDMNMRRAGLDPAMKRRFPHQFSGGQRQRIGIARALAANPEFLICDEAVAALDVSIQAQILNLFMDLREQLGLTYLFISHDLGVVQHISDSVAIMYLGRIVESADAKSIFARPNHPYTRALLAEVPRIDSRRARFNPIKGELPSPMDPPRGCHFHPRCPLAMPRCRQEAPKLRQIAPGHVSACHLNDMQ